MKAKLTLVCLLMSLLSTCANGQAQLDTLWTELKKPFTGEFDVETFQWKYGAGCNLCCSICWTIEASSMLKPVSKNTYETKNLEDFNHRTAWVEGAEGYGEGERIIVKFGPPDRGKDKPFSGIDILNGYCKNEAIWKANSRVRKLKLYHNGTAKFVIALHDSMLPQVINWGWERLLVNEGDTIFLEILQVYAGTKHKDTAISELNLNGGH